MSISSPHPLPGDFAESLELKKHWGWMVAFGVLLSLAGFVALGSVLFATISTVLVVGIAMIVSGIGEIIHGFAMRSWKKFFFWIVIGILYVVAGYSVFQNPLLAAGVLTLLLGAGLVASGLVRSVLAFQLPLNSPRVLVFFSGVLSLAVGALILAQLPGSSLWVIGTLLGVDLIFAGVSWIGEGFSLSRTHG
jgi:aquaporin Z